MILLLGATGYVGGAFAKELRRRDYRFIPLSRDAFDYTRFNLLFDYVRKIKPTFLINAAGYSGRPNIDACESNRMETFQANALLPQVIGRVCQMTNTPWGHVSSGSIYAGAKVFQGGELRVEKDLSAPRLRQLFEAQPELFRGFTELDEPNCTFRCAPCSFYSGTKALAEEALRDSPCYIWRGRMPFDVQDSPRNLLSRLQGYARIYDTINSLSHLGDFVGACMDLWERQSPFGVYNMTNPGAVSNRQIVAMIQRLLRPARKFEYFEDEAEFYRHGAKALRAGCILDASKLQRAGVELRPVEDALEDSLKRWQPAVEAAGLPRRQPEPATAFDWRLSVAAPETRLA